MSNELLRKYASKNLVTSVSKAKFPFEKLSHLYLNGKGLTSIGDLENYKNIKVLYLHSNNISEVNNLSPLHNLTHLYLQWNKITTITNLNCLPKLEKLYLGYNEIERMENMDKLTSLKELHLEGQRILKPFEFELDSLRTLSYGLVYLNVSKLNLANINDLQMLQHLETLVASENQFSNAEEIGKALSNMPRLRTAFLHGCPAQKDAHYREKITALADYLEILDDRVITRNNRKFIKKFLESREQRQLKILRQTSKVKPETNTSNIENPEKGFYILKNVSDDISFHPWNSLHCTQKPPRRAKRSQFSSIKSQSYFPLHGRNLST